MRRFLSAAVLVAIAAAAPAAGPIADGNWLLAGISATGEVAQMIIKVETKDGKQTASLLFAPPATLPPAQAGGQRRPAPPPEIRDFAVKGNEVSFAVSQNGATRTFVGTVGPDVKRIPGSLGTDTSALRAVLTATDKEKIEAADRVVRSPAAESFLKASQLQLKPQQLQLQARAETNAEKKAELLKEATAAQRAMTTELPKVFRAVIAEHKDTPAAYDAAMALLQNARRDKATLEDVTGWVAIVEKQGAVYGPRFTKPALTTVADTLADVKEFSPIAVRLTEPIVAAIKDSDPASVQVKILTILKTALENAGRGAEAKALEVRLEKLETKLDAEYLATVPPFKPEAYAGRKDKAANKVVVMELFTGAQCPPCVAADVAFDALNKSYKNTDLILLQYHLHIPGPDPLTNPDTLARAKQYGVNSTPSTFFAGKADARGGGGMAAARNKYVQYKGIIDPLLEEKTDVKVAGTFGRAGDNLSATVTVSGADPEAKLTLRIVVVEENIKYVGSNGLRFHHEVVRTVMGGAEGFAITEKAFKKSASADVAAVKKGIHAYLDDYALNTRPFPYKHRPMDLGHLKAIALVQNDTTHEIVQAAVLTPGGEKTSATVGR